MGIVFAEMFSTAALTCHTGIKTVYLKEKYEKEMSDDLYKEEEVIEENA